jgi:hypothetical protein
MEKSKKNVLKVTIGVMSPFIFMSLLGYTLPLILDITFRTSVLLYIYGAINQLIALNIGVYASLFYKLNEVKPNSSPK